MQDKMKKLLDQIGMKHDFLENASIEKITVYDKTNLWEFIISNDKVLPVYIYDELCNKIKSTFKGIDDIVVIINTKEEDNEYLDDYFDKLINHLVEDSSRNRVLNQLVRIENQKLKEKLETTLGGDIDEKMNQLINDTQDFYTNAYGSEFSQELTQAMAEDNKTFIQAGTGEISSVGMGLTLVGGILCFTPLAPLGGAMVSLGNVTAMGGMAAGTVVGGIEAGTRANTDIEEVTDLTKDFIMNADKYLSGKEYIDTMCAKYKEFDK